MTRALRFVVFPVLLSGCFYGTPMSEIPHPVWVDGGLRGMNKLSCEELVRKLVSARDLAECLGKHAQGDRTGRAMADYMGVQVAALEAEVASRCLVG